MTQNDFSLSQQPLKERAAGVTHDRTGAFTEASTFFPVTTMVSFQPVAAAPDQKTSRLPANITRLISVVTLGAALFLSSCSSSENCRTTSSISRTATAVAKQEANSEYTGIGNQTQCSNSGG